MRTILCKDNEGEFKIEVPDNVRFTFGPNVPFKPKEGYGNPSPGYSLRVYEGEKLLATFCNVLWFRDTAIKQSRLVMREAGKSLWKNDETGYETETKVTREQNWVELDAVIDEPKKGRRK